MSTLHWDTDGDLNSLLADEVESNSSCFTCRDLKNLGRASTATPLRVIALIDFDAFYAQCETVRLGLPRERPLAVQQWNSIIALNYPAKAAGLKRGITAENAQAQCPEIFLQHVATWREGSASWAYRSDVREHLKTDKAALDPYRLQSRKAFDLIKSKLPPSPVQKVEKAGIDEVFCDLSAQVYHILLERYPELQTVSSDADALDSKLPLPLVSLIDWQTNKLVDTGELSQEARPADWDDVALNVGSEIVHSLRAEIYKRLQYTCSAGIARNKPLAKLAAGHNKPNQQTVVRTRDIDSFLSDYKFTKIRGLAGKLGQQVVTAFGTDKVAALRRASQQELSLKLGSHSGQWVYNVIRGHEYSEVVERTILQSMLSAKTFVPRLTGLEQAEKWLRIFAGDLMGRLSEEDAVSLNRRPRVISFHHHIDGRFGPTRSKQTAIPLTAEINADLLYSLSQELLGQLCTEGPSWPCLGLSVSISDFEDCEANNRRLTSFFTRNTSEPWTAAILEQQPSTDVHRTTTKAQTVVRKRGLLEFEGFKTLNSYAEEHTIVSTPSSIKKHKTLVTRPSEEADFAESQSNTTIGSYDCPKCKQNIPASNVLEHLDWHVAMELQHTDAL